MRRHRHRLPLVLIVSLTGCFQVNDDAILVTESSSSGTSSTSVGNSVDSTTGYPDSGEATSHVPDGTSTAGSSECEPCVFGKAAFDDACFQ